MRTSIQIEWEMERLKREKLAVDLIEGSRMTLYQAFLLIPHQNNVPQADFDRLYNDFIKEAEKLFSPEADGRPVGGRNVRNAGVIQTTIPLDSEQLDGDPYVG
jgi:hypothetical protein